MTDHGAPSVRPRAIQHESAQAPDSCARTPAPDQTCATDQSSARAEASRRNGAKSRGPKTAEGKARSAQNALKHGLRAHRFVLLADEHMVEFQALEEALRAELAPEGALQNMIVARIAVAAWRMLRGDRMEIELLNPHVGLDARGRPGGVGLALIRDGHGQRAIDTLLRYRGAVQAEFWRALRALSALKAEAPVAIELAARADLPAQGQATSPAKPACAGDRSSPVEREPEHTPNETERCGNLHEPPGYRSTQRIGAVPESARDLKHGNPNEPGRRWNPWRRSPNEPETRAIGARRPSGTCPTSRRSS
jgi:hypothetical protein